MHNKKKLSKKSAKTVVIQIILKKWHYENQQFKASLYSSVMIILFLAFTNIKNKYFTYIYIIMYITALENISYIISSKHRVDINRGSVY